MIVQIKEFAQKAAILIGICAACGTTGFVVPLLFDRDVGGALAATIFGITGLIVGAIAGLIVIRRNFD
jgi:hypothetical protein